ncbi:carbohydrate sulfotransferase 3-like [Strongylocentrotus purpuratus]|uniref:Sulfotransferase domain-containing protein n=1 Tax=Strongylocentrotus purpuratus TaxID=7668 RepID=A0A7M7GRF0_STRPU|nr:carbohydrate sulfotransferase 3-like [Strongylocentrotus purpuratus]
MAFQTMPVFFRQLSLALATKSRVGRFSLAVLALCVCILFGIQLQYSTNPSTTVKENPVFEAITGTSDVRKSAKVDESPPFIILMTQWRFGSTVLGELFNQNLELFYIFESLFPTTKLRKLKNVRQNTPENKEMARDILRGFAKCDFKTDYVKILSNWGGSYTMNRGLCLNSTSCRLHSASALGDFCKEFKGRLATKIIHADLDLLKPLVVEDGINLKIIHLVRDPRGAASSRINYLMNIESYSKNVAEARPFFPNLGRLKPLGLLDGIPEYMLPVQEINDNNPTVRGLCQWIRENTKRSSDPLPPWLQGRYHLVIYEDFAKAPLTEAEKIYNFIGMPLKPELKKFVHDMTHSNSSDTSLFSTSKDAHKTANKWMKDLTVMEERQILKECLDVLQLLGYEPNSSRILPES